MAVLCFEVLFRDRTCDERVSGHTDFFTGGFCILSLIVCLVRSIQYASFRRNEYDGVSTVRVVAISCVGFLCNISLALIGMFKEQLQPVQERYGLVTELDTYSFSGEQPRCAEITTKRISLTVVHVVRISDTRRKRLSNVLSWMWPFTGRLSTTSRGHTDSLDELLMAEGGGEVSALEVHCLTTQVSLLLFRLMPDLRPVASPEPLVSGTTWTTAVLSQGGRRR